MGLGGARKGAGRPKGGKNAMSDRARQEAALTGELPHNILLRIARGEMMKFGKEGLEFYPTPDMQLDAAKAAAPYFAPRLAQIESNNNHTSTITVLSSDPPSEAEWLKQYAPESENVQ